ncbi:predicted protein [Postia placenta Mad-698-R]|nr:predicted protein [Postia placenta Mad-698-R]
MAYHVTLNLPHDVRCLWGRRSIATLVSVMNWLVIAGDIIAFGPLPINTTSRCEDGGYASEILYIVTVAISPCKSYTYPEFLVVAALRVHAVSGGNWRLVLPVWLLGMVPVGTNIVGTWRITKFVPLNQDYQSGAQPNITYSDATSNAYVDLIDSGGFYALIELCRMVIISRTSIVVSDILVVGATWYYISHTSSVKTQLVREVWDARPNLTTVMFRDGTLYFLMSSILISRFLICIREAAERSTQAFSSQSLSFIDSQGDSNPQPWLSSAEFATDIANPSAGDNGRADAFSDLEDDLDPRDDAGEGRDGGIELEEYAASVCSVDAHTP